MNRAKTHYGDTSQVSYLDACKTWKSNAPSGYSRDFMIVFDVPSDTEPSRQTHVHFGPLVLPQVMLHTNRKSLKAQ